MSYHTFKLGDRVRRTDHTVHPPYFGHEATVVRVDPNFIEVEWDIAPEPIPQTQYGASGNNLHRLFDIIGNAGHDWDEFLELV